ncbi:hypothetical protein N0V90_006295 [Kalmusia sp. IMI 367209]|nr:hypothetical protein N0V90_006295 [Kalmusia sp. IMI 367209]
MDLDKQNANPTILNPSDLPSRRRDSNVKRRDDGGTGLFDNLVPQYSYLIDPFEQPLSSSDSDDDTVEDIDEQEVYDLISSISDPEHPLSLGSLAVVNLPDIHIQPPSSPSLVYQHCRGGNHTNHHTLLTGNCHRPRDVRIKKGTHSTDEAVNKQLGDKERVAAALENGTLMGVLRKMLSTCE